MKKILIVGIVGMLFIGIKPVSAQESDFDPLARNLIFVEGESELTVPIDGFSLDFDFDVDKASFEDASRESARMIEEMQKGAQALGLSEVEVVKGWDVVKQARISFGSKGRKISNQVTLKVRNFPDGKVYETISAVIDKCLAIDGSVGLSRVTVFVSEAIEHQKRQEVLTQALKDLETNAAKSAEALGRKLTAAKRVFLSSEAAPYAAEGEFDSYKAKYAPSAMSMAKMVSVQKSFKVNAEIVDHVKISAKVVGIYEIQ